MDLFDMLLLWAHMQGGHLDTHMDSMSTLETPIAPIFVVLVAAYFGSFCCPATGECTCGSNINNTRNTNSANTRANSSRGANSTTRKVWKIPRQSTYWDTMVERQRTWTADEEVRDSHWQAQYRMSYRAFQALIDELRPFIERSSNTVRDPIELDRVVAMVLHRLASGLPPSTIANLYNVGPSTVTKYTKQITEILASRDKLYSKFVSIPSGERLTSAIAKFQDMTDIPNICGAIDGTHIKLWRKPRLQDVPKFYWNKYYKFYSVLLQGVCDADKVFWDVSCNAPGGMHDEVHWRSSRLWQMLKTESVLEQPIALGNGGTVRPVLVGDVDYPIAPFLITPFQQNSNSMEIPPGAADKMEHDFDEVLTKAHSCVESAFGILKKRWGILANLNIGLQYAPQVVVACCVLHNFCQLAGEKEPEDHIDLQPNSYNNANSSGPLDQSDQEIMVEAMAGRAYREVLFSEWAERRGGCRGY
ncbi:unnamed protein product [Calypogeia fissa]